MRATQAHRGPDKPLAVATRHLATRPYCRLGGGLPRQPAFHLTQRNVLIRIQQEGWNQCLYCLTQSLQYLYAAGVNKLQCDCSKEKTFLTAVWSAMFTSQIMFCGVRRYLFMFVAQCRWFRYYNEYWQWMYLIHMENMYYNYVYFLCLI